MILTALSIIFGAAIGWLLPWLDRVAYVFILHPEAQAAQYIKYQLDKKQYRTALTSLNARACEFDKPTTRGLLFRLSWVILAFFAVTSSAGWFGKTLVLMLGLRLLVEEWREFFSNKTALRKRLLWQVKRDWTETELKIYLIGMSLAVAWLVRLAV